MPGMLLLDWGSVNTSPVESGVPRFAAAWGVQRNALASSKKKRVGRDSCVGERKGWYQKHGAELGFKEGGKTKTQEIQT